MFQFADVISRIMKVNASERLSIKEILSHNLFANMKNVPDMDETYEEDFESDEYEEDFESDVEENSSQNSHIEDTQKLNEDEI